MKENAPATRMTGLMGRAEKNMQHPNARKLLQKKHHTKELWAGYARSAEEEMRRGLHDARAF